jgi:hypothetical protein
VTAVILVIDSHHDASNYIHRYINGHGRPGRSSGPGPEDEGTVAATDGGLGQAVLMRPRHSQLPAPRSSFAGFRFPPEVITVAVRWYLRYGLSYRDVEELLVERGIEVDHVTVFRWVQRFTPLLIDAARPCRHAARGSLVR